MDSKPAISPRADSGDSMSIRRSLTKDLRADLYMFGLPFWNASYEEITKWWQGVLAQEDRSGLVLAFANAHTLTLTFQNQEFRSALAAADVLVNDGKGFQIASRMRGVEVRDNLNGSDLVPHLLSISTQRVRVFIYGGSESANAGAAEALKLLSPNIFVVGLCNGYVDPIAVALPAIRAAQADVVLVALGHPEQEIFCANHRDALNCKIVLPVGGLIDFLSKTKPRAPQILRQVGLEWTYRFAIEPKRMFRRYVVGIPVFLTLSLLHSGRDKLLQKNLISGSNTWRSSKGSHL